MNGVAWAALLLLASGNAAAEFTCEKIQDTETRNECIYDRIKTREMQKARVINPGKEQADVADANGELADFVRKAKDVLTNDYKDPSSAQFKNLIVAVDGSYQRSLCGSVNGKNSYGAYVGFKRFNVTWVTGVTIPIIWHEFETTKTIRDSKYQVELERAAKIEAVEAELFNVRCGPSSTNKITKVEN